MCVGGGGGSSGRVYVHVVKFIGGLCSRCKIHRGDYVHVAKFMGDFVYVYNFGQGGGGLSRGGWGIMSYTK